MARPKSTDPKARARFVQVRCFPCPVCKAKSGERCTGGKDRVRYTFHNARWNLAEGRKVENVRDIACSECGAAAGQNCVSPTGRIRVSNHQVRGQEFRAWKKENHEPTANDGNENSETGTQTDGEAQRIGETDS